ncbi:MAG: hypothetical protein RDU14_00940 [Melioribacteraceae bacterium]|nr:hypothetical protein [Melioribacteraceae bacterium]
MITFIKTIHTIIWVIMALATFYIGYSVIVMKFDLLFYISLFLILSESIVILVNSWRCPLTNIARKYTEEESPNFDIYLPLTIAKYNKEIFSVILTLIFLIYIYNSFV